MNKINYSWDLNATEELEQETNSSFELLTLDFFDPEKQIEKQWMQRTGLDTETISAAVETIIFMSEKPISLLKIKSSIDNDIPVRVVHEAIEKLQTQYETKTHGIRLQEVAEGYQFRTKATYSRFVQGFLNAKTLTLSANALEVLAIIAYRQPVSKTEIDKIRGVDSSHLVRGLMDKRLVKVEGRSDELGRPSTYATTSEFLEVFNLSDISQLPPESDLNDLATSKGVGEIADIKTIVGGDKKKFFFDEMEELEKLSAQIHEIPVDTNFTNELKEEKRKESKSVENKTAFELLEEYVARQQVSQQNKLSTESEILTTVDEVSVVNPSELEDLFARNEGEEFMDQGQVTEAIDEVMAQIPSELLEKELSEDNEQDWLEKKLDELDSKTESVISELKNEPEPEAGA